MAMGRWPTRPILVINMSESEWQTVHHILEFLGVFVLVSCATMLPGWMAAEPELNLSKLFDAEYEHSLYGRQLIELWILRFCVFIGGCVVAVFFLGIGSYALSWVFTLLLGLHGI